MKKTSKKLLSFFLAVVMAVTSCSVGFTAFAADNSKTTSNGYWTDVTDANGAFDAIEGIITSALPTILNLEISGKKIYSSLGWSKKQADSATLQDVIAKASPLLANELPTLLSSLNINIPSSGTSSSATRDLKQFLINHTTVSGVTENNWSSYEKYFSYLTDANAKETDIEFVDLYNFCEANQNSTETAVATYCQETLEKLNYYLGYIKNFISGTEGVSTKAANSYTAFNAIRSAKTTTSNKTLAQLVTAGASVEEIGNAEITTVTINKVKFTNVKVNDLVNVDNDTVKGWFADGVKEANEALKESGSKVEVNTVAEAFAYYYVFPNGARTFYSAQGNNGSLRNGITYQNAAEMIRLAQKGGTPITTKRIGGSEDEKLTTDNFEEVVAKYLPELKANGTYSNEFANYVAGENEYSFVPRAVYECLGDLLADGTSNNLANNTYRNLDAFASSSYEAINKALLMENDITDSKKTDAKKLTDAEKKISDAKITEKQYRLLYEASKEYSTYDEFKTYIGSDNCDLSSYAKEFFTSTNTMPTQDINDFFLKLQRSNSFDEAKKITNTAASGYSLYNYISYRKAGNGVYNQVDFFNEIVSGYVTMKVIHGLVSGKLPSVSSPVYDSIQNKLYKNILNAVSENNLQYSYEKKNAEGKYLFKIEDSTVQAAYEKSTQGSYTDVEALNNMLNTYVFDQLLNENDPSGIGYAVKKIVESDIVLYKDANGNETGVLKDLWLNLYNSPVQTIVNILPLLVTVVDEFIVPSYINGEGDAYHTGQILDIYSILESSNATLLAPIKGSDGKPTGKYKIARDKNGKIGAGATVGTFDLNKILPIALAYVSGNESYKKSAVEKYAENGKLTTYGDYLAANGFNGTYREDSTDATSKVINDVPNITGFYIVDKYIGTIDINSFITDNSKKLDATLNKGLTELIQEIAGFAYEAADEYLDECKADSTHADYRYAKEASDTYLNPSASTSVDPKAAIAQTGLNNIVVALPNLIEKIGQKFIKKYDIKSDWTYLYSGKFSSKTKTFEDGTVTQKTNAKLDAFKAMASEESNAKSAVEILDQTMNALVGTWINSLLDLLNDALVPGNKLTNNVSLVAGLVQAIGGLGEKSVLTDILNGFFGLTREDKASFTFEPQANNFTGLSTETAYFLVSNILFTYETKDKDGKVTSKEERGLIPLITAIAKGGISKGSSSSSSSSSNSSSSSSSSTSKKPTLVNSSKANKKYDKSTVLTSKNIKNANSLLTKLDTLLASLLDNSSLNDFKLNSNENILAGVLTTASNYLGEKNTQTLLTVVDSYLKVFDTTAKNGNVDAEKVYSSDNLSNIVLNTYKLLDSIVDYVFYDTKSGLFRNSNDRRIIGDAVKGLYSPDAMSVRLNKASTRNLEGKRDWSQISSINYSISTGNKSDFYDALGESFSTVAAVLGAVLTYSYTDSSQKDNLYSAVVEPVLSAVAKHTGAEGVVTASQFNSMSGSEQLVKGILTPLANILSQFYKAPATFLVNLVASLGEVLNDEALRGIVNSAVGAVNEAIGGIKYLIGDSSMLNAPSLVKYLCNLISSKVSAFDSTLMLKVELPKENILVSLIGSIKISSINMTIGQLVSLKTIDWTALTSAKTAGEKLLLIFSYVVDVLLSSPVILGLVKDAAPELVKLLESFDPGQILAVLSAILDVTQSPTEVFWTFKEYAGKITNTFVYPKNITAKEADEGVENLDKLVQNVFPLLKDLGVLDAEDLTSLVNGLLYTNGNLTSLTKAVYGGIYSAAKKANITSLLKALGLDFSPKGVANILMDSSYGKTYSSAAKGLKKAKSWKKVTKLNWGFKDGSSKAQQGFVNALAALLRPVNDVLSIFLAEGKGLDLNLDASSKKEIIKMVKTINVKKTSIGGIQEKDAYGCKLYLEIKNGVLIITVDSNASDKNSTIKLDINGVAKTALDMLADSNINIGTNGYENAIIPILEAFLCKDVVTYDEYISDYEDEKDNLIIDILNPIVGLVDDILAAPGTTLTSILPNVAYFIDSYGLSQAVSNLLAPITAKNGVLGILKKNGIDVDKLIKQIAGKSLGKLITDALGVNVKLNLKLTNLAKCNIQDIVLPLVKTLLKKNKINIKIPAFTCKEIASHGKIVKAESAAKNSEGKYTRKMVKADNGEMFVALLRYVGDVLIKNATTLNNLLGSIDAIKNNKTIKDILNCVFSSLKVATKDDIVRAVFYFLTQNGAQDSFFDYTGFVSKKYDFSFGNMDEEFCRKLAPMLDGLIAGLLPDGLLGLLGGMVYTDDIISSLACGLYGAIDGVDLGDMGSLTALLAKTDIDFTTTNVANLLTDKRYGKTFDKAAKVIAKAGSWKNVKKSDLKWGVKDRETFLNALVAVLRPIYGVVDVLLNNGNLNLFNIVSVPGSNGYTSFIVPLLEAFGVYNIKTQYDYRMDMEKAYDAILLDILNPLMDKVEDILNAPVEMLADILPNLSLFFANDGLLQLIDNLLTPVSALLDAIKPIINVNVVLDVLGLDVNALLGKIGIKSNVKIDVYNLKATLEPLIGSDNVVSLLNGILGVIKISGQPLGLELPEIDWYQLASHGKVVSTTSQVATFGTRIAVEADQDETLIAVLRYLINTINYKDNYDTIVNLLGGLLGGLSDSIAGVIDQVLGMLKGDADSVIESLVDLLQSIAG